MRAMCVTALVLAALHFGTPSVAAERRQLTGEEIRQRIVGRLLHWKRPRRSGHVALWAIVRPDGSFASKCEYYNPRRGAWSLCTGPSGTFGGWANGVWTIEGNLYCSNTVVRGFKGRACFRLYDDSGRLFVEQASGDRRSGFRGYVGSQPLKPVRCVGNFKKQEC